MEEERAGVLPAPAEKGGAAAGSAGGRPSEIDVSEELVPAQRGGTASAESTPSPKKREKKLRMRYEHLRVVQENLQKARELQSLRPGRYEHAPPPSPDEGPTCTHADPGSLKGAAMAATVVFMVCALLGALVLQSKVNTDFLIRERGECERRVAQAEERGRRALDKSRGHPADWIRAAVEEEKRKWQGGCDTRVRDEVKKVEALCNARLASCRELKHACPGAAGEGGGGALHAGWQIERAKLLARVADLEEHIEKQNNVCKADQIP